MRFIGMSLSLRNILVLVFTIFICANAFSQKVSIFVRDNESDDYHFSSMKKCSDSIAANNFLESYIAKMQRKSYLSAGYDSISVIDKDLTAYATLGQPLRNVNVDVSEVPFRIWRKGGSPLFYTQLCGQVVDYYTARGYIFAKSWLDSVNMDENSFSAKLKVDKGQIVKLDSLIINGNAKINRNYLERTLELRKNTLLTTDKIDRIDSRITNIPFLEQEQPFQLAFSETKSDVLLFLKNKKASSFSGVLGIMPKSYTTGKLMITGDIDLNLVNVFHQGENLKFKWKKYETQNQNLDVGFAFPYIFKSPIGVGADFNLEKKDSSYIKTDFYGKVMVGNSTSKGFYIYYRNTSSFPIGDNSDTTLNYTKYKTNLFGFGVDYCNVDNVRNPRRGIVFKATADAGQKRADEEPNPLFQSTVYYDFSGYIGFLRNFAVKLRNSSRFIYSKSIFDNELMWVGGLNTVRGFDELSLPATYYTLGNIELRYLFERNSAVYVLTDAMYFGKMFTAESARNFALGIGVGIDLSTPAGIFSLVYAIGKQNSNPFSFNNSKIHFGYKSYF
ncbi:MAG: BamA/TamA family outer membrane protein [Bacteroidales bacterium]|nr:BamA/TamA family outer membrane protein [Bacteroidales bacterium]